MLFEESRQHEYKQRDSEYYIDDNLDPVPNKGVECNASKVAGREGDCPGNHAPVGRDEDKSEPEDAPGYVWAEKAEHG